MEINGVNFVVGEKYLVDNIEMVLSELFEVDDNCNPFICLEGEPGTWELWYGTTPYYTQAGWHGADGEEPADDAGATIVKL